MANMTIWQMQISPKWYTKLERRVWTSLEVTFGVWPVALGHRAGAVWTADGWQTVNWTDATWEGNIPNLYGGNDEKWKVIMQLGSSPYPVSFWYALYVEDSHGNKSWDNNNSLNYEYIV